MMIFHGVPLECINQAAIRYHVPAAIIVSVMQTEKGRNGMAVKNKNGTYDLGVMQVNSSWVAPLRTKGVTTSSLKNDPCVNVLVGSWILARGIAKSDGWQGVGNYHSATFKYNHVYQEKIKMAYFNDVGVLQREA